jgi:hypothetical protein
MNKIVHRNEVRVSRDYRTGSEAIERLELLEKKHDLFKHTIDGYSAWKLLRFKAMIEIQNLPFDVKPDYVTWDWLKERLMQTLPDFLRFLFPRRARVVAKTSSAALREGEDGLYKDVYFDDFTEIMKDIYKIETLNSSAYRERRKYLIYPIDSTTSFIDLFSLFCASLGFPKKFEPVINQIGREIREEPLLNSLSDKRIARTLRRFYWAKRLYASLLKRIGVTYVMTANQNEYAIWAAARQVGAITLELQHGLFPRYDPDALTAHSIKYRESLIVPDRILLYGQYWKDELDRNQVYSGELIVVGRHQIDKYRKKRRILLQNRIKAPLCRILLTTQGIDRKNLIEFIAGFLKIAQGKLDYQLHIKLHPGFETDKQEYVSVLGSFPAVHILLGSEDPSTLELQANADFHLSISSASHYDALGIGVPTVILPLATYEEVLHLVDAGHAKLADTPEELLNIILKDRGLQVPAHVSDYYYAPKALVNFQHLLRSITGEQQN